MNTIYQCNQNISHRHHFYTEMKGHNSDNNQCILSIIDLELYFMIIYLCMKYESNTSMSSKNIAQKLSFTEIKGHTSDNNQWIISIIEIDLYIVIIYLCMKYEYNIPM